jgi:hypothetical protein
VAWQSFRVSLKGEAEPIDVQTNARDWANVPIDPGAPKAMDMTFRVVHAALVREGVGVPRNYDAFLEVLDGIPESVEEGDANALDPTNAEPSGG